MVSFPYFVYELREIVIYHCPNQHQDFLFQITERACSRLLTFLREFSFEKKCVYSGHIITLRENPNPDIPLIPVKESYVQFVHEEDISGLETAVHQ